MKYNHKKISAYLTLLFALIFLSVYTTKTFTSLGTATILFSFSLVIIFISLVFVKEQVFRIWLKTAIIFVPIAIFIFLISPVTGGDLFFPIDKKVVSLFLASVFLVVSLFIIAIKSFKLRQEGKINQEK